MNETEIVEYIVKNNIQGCFVECGIDTAKKELLWIETLRNYKTLRHIYMYDTFGGLTKPGPNDYLCDSYTNPDQMKTLFGTNEKVSSYWNKQVIDKNINNWCYTPLSVVKHKLHNTGYPTEYLHYIIGDVLETLDISTNIPNEISLLRLDTDWYDSSKKELEVLYNKVVPNGIIVFDDYYLWNGQRKAVDEFFQENELKHNIIQIDSQTGYITKN